MTDPAGTAAAYDAWYATPLGDAAHRIELDLVASMAAPLSGERALDAGCGTGVYSAWLAELGLDVTGVDLDRAFLAAARQKVPGARFVEADICSLPFEDGEFDLALVVTVLCFLGKDDRRRAASELVRVVRPGGRIVVGELGRLSLWAIERRVKGWLGSPTWRAARFSTASELEQLFRSAGAGPVTARHALYLPPIDRAWSVRRAEAIERSCRRLGRLGAAFVAVRADVPRGTAP